MSESTNSASSLRLSSASPSSPSCARHERQVVSCSSVLVSVIGASLGGLVPHASSPVSVAAWVAPYRPLLAFTTLTYPVTRPFAAWSTLLAYSSVMAREGRPGLPCDRSTSSATFLPMRSCFCARRIDLRSVLLISTSDDVPSASAISLKNREDAAAIIYQGWLHGSHR